LLVCSGTVGGGDDRSCFRRLLELVNANMLSAVDSFGDTAPAPVPVPAPAPAAVSMIFVSLEDKTSPPNETRVFLDELLDEPAIFHKCTDRDYSLR